MPRNAKRPKPLEGFSVIQTSEELAKEKVSSMTTTVDTGTPRPLVSEDESFTIDAAQWKQILSRVEKLEEKSSNHDHIISNALTVATNLKAENESPTPVKQEATGESEVQTVVREVCGDGFEAHVEPATSGVSFKLVIVPPEHLREKPGDMRVRIITLADGISGVRIFAELVKKYCVEWASKNGVTYAKET